PNPLVISQNPQSDKMSGVIRRMAGDLFLFTSLSKGDRYLWINGLIMHVTLAILMGFHLFGLVSYLAERGNYIHISPEIMGFLSTIASIIGVIFIVSLIMLMIKRSNDEKSAYYTKFFDYFIILLIFMIGVTGVFMKISSFSPDLPAVKSFMIGAFTFHSKPVPLNMFFITHIALVSILLIVFPFTKLIHAVGFFFSPTRNMPNNPREVRHINVWDTNNGD
ncbi:MAG: respiratory nitrate reductase subunit gamma, partial [Nitrospirae bacterium]|nr:respiratory nitrate reductase subunit gamma [Nitrospirota bacterium]